jgi:anhydro-N-acetylmuramic acid kinase
MMRDEIRVIGLMSGTSLDGVDLACCHFHKGNSTWSYEMEVAETISYTRQWKDNLLQLISTDAMSYVETHVMLGRLYGVLINEFIAKNKLQPNLVASHGHTIFHQPQRGFTSQIGDGSQIAALTGIDTVCDFRSKDVALGGQGAPLVPFGEQMLFKDYRFCLNLGGIANLTFNEPGKQVAFDVCIANMALNEIAAQRELLYDEDGKIAATGSTDIKLLNTLNALEYFNRPYPKSLGREWYEKNFLPLIADTAHKDADVMFTLCEHIAMQVGKALGMFDFNATDEVLVTGGGGFNATLIKRIQHHAPVKVVLPDKKIIAFKEALIFAFLGALYIKDEINISSSVTGSLRSHIGGALYKGN